MQLDSLREAGDLVFEGIDRDELGDKVEVSCNKVYARAHYSFRFFFAVLFCGISMKCKYCCCSM